MICDENTFPVFTAQMLGGFTRTKVAEETLDKGHSDAWGVILNSFHAPAGVLAVESKTGTVKFFSGSRSWSFDFLGEFDKWFAEKQMSIASCLNGYLDYRVHGDDDAADATADLIHINYATRLLKFWDAGDDVDDMGLGASRAGVNLIVGKTIPEPIVLIDAACELMDEDAFIERNAQEFMKDMGVV